MPLIIVLILVIVFFGWMWASYNSIVKLRNRRLNAFADIDVQLRQRHDLVPQLVETVKGYAGHEREVLSRVTEARGSAMNAATIDDKIQKEQQLTSALQGLRVAVEAYPNLKANENFIRLQDKLSEIEFTLAASRRQFNAVTTDLNTAVQTFPGNMVARNYGFTTETFFDLGTEVRKQFEEPPVVKF
jgi:LemA protein